MRVSVDELWCLGLEVLMVRLGPWILSCLPMLDWQHATHTGRPKTVGAHAAATPNTPRLGLAPAVGRSGYSTVWTQNSRQFQRHAGSDMASGADSLPVSCISARYDVH